MSGPCVRDVTTGDARALLEEESVPDADEMSARITAVVQRYPWLVAEREGRVCGYAYAHEFRARQAYRFSVEVSVYVDASLHRSGIGRALYAALFERLHDRGYHRAFAGIALPNEASIALHRAMGFEPVGVYREAGFKFGRWIDVSWWQRSL